MSKQLELRLINNYDELSICFTGIPVLISKEIIIQFASSNGAIIVTYDLICFKNKSDLLTVNNFISTLL